MSISTATAYRSRFAGRIAPAGSRKSPENKPFHGHRSTYSRQAHCIKDRVLLDPACVFGSMFIQSIKFIKITKKKIAMMYPLKVRNTT